MVNGRLDPAAVDAVPDEQVRELWEMWVSTCPLPEEIRDAFREDPARTSDMLGMRIAIAKLGYETARKAVLAMPVSPDHDGSRHRHTDGNPLVRRDIGTLIADGHNLADFWDSRR